MNKPITKEELVFAEAKAKGLSNSKSAMLAKPGISPASAGMAGTRLIKSDNVQALLAKKLRKHNINIDRALAPIDRGLDAKKVVIVGKGDDAFADVQEDIALQLSASDRALKLLGVTDKPKDAPAQGNDELAPALLEAIKAGNIEELQRVIFKQPDNPA